MQRDLQEEAPGDAEAGRLHDARRALGHGVPAHADLKQTSKKKGTGSYRTRAERKKKKQKQARARNTSTQRRGAAG